MKNIIIQALSVFMLFMILSCKKSDIQPQTGFYNTKNLPKNCTLLCNSFGEYTIKQDSNWRGDRDIWTSKENWYPAYLYKDGVYLTWWPVLDDHCFFKDTTQMMHVFNNVLISIQNRERAQHVSDSIFNVRRTFKICN